MQILSSWNIACRHPNNVSLSAVCDQIRLAGLHRFRRSNALLVISHRCMNAPVIISCLKLVFRIAITCSGIVDYASTHTRHASVPRTSTRPTSPVHSSRERRQLHLATILHQQMVGFMLCFDRVTLSTSTSISESGTVKQLTRLVRLSGLSAIATVQQVTASYDTL